jgi:hypothetical protein
MRLFQELSNERSDNILQSEIFDTMKANLQAAVMLAAPWLQKLPAGQAAQPDAPALDLYMPQAEYVTAEVVGGGRSGRDEQRRKGRHQQRT